MGAGNFPIGLFDRILSFWILGIGPTFLLMPSSFRVEPMVSLATDSGPVGTDDVIVLDGFNVWIGLFCSILIVGGNFTVGLYGRIIPLWIFELCNTLFVLSFCVDSIVRGDLVIPVADFCVAVEVTVLGRLRMDMHGGNFTIGLYVPLRSLGWIVFSNAVPVELASTFDFDVPGAATDSLIRLPVNGGFCIGTSAGVCGSGKVVTFITGGFGRLVFTIPGFLPFTKFLFSVKRFRTSSSVFEDVAPTGAFLKVLTVCETCSPFEFLVITL